MRPGYQEPSRRNLSPAVLRSSGVAWVRRCTRSKGTVAILDFRYLVGTPAGIEYFTKHHELGLFTDEEYRAAFAEAGLEVRHDAEGLIGRGLYIGTRAPA